MRVLPANVDADLVIAIGRLLDDHSPMAPVSIAETLTTLQKQKLIASPSDDTELLIIEMAGSRGLAVLLDQGDVEPSPKATKSRAGLTADRKASDGRAAGNRSGR